MKAECRIEIRIVQPKPKRGPWNSGFDTGLTRVLVRDREGIDEIIKAMMPNSACGQKFVLPGATARISNQS
jgi:hypothetical protein